MKKYRQGDVLIVSTDNIPGNPEPEKKLPHLTLAKGEVTGHAHKITEGDAELYEHEGTLFLKVISEEALLSHEEHLPILLPRGNYEIKIQKEYEPGGWRKVSD